MPKKKKRDSLSILKALASTVEPIKGPAYQDIDDPYLLTTRSDQLTCYLSKASGQKTARYFVNKYRSAFEHEDMAPFVQSFQPDKGEYEFASLCDEAIRERLQRRQVLLACEVYTKMKQQDLEVSEEVKLELLEYMCMFNSQDPPQDTHPLELITSTKREPTEAASLQAQDVFDDLAEKTSQAYNWMLQGQLMSTEKGETATALYKEMKEKNIKFEQNTYHLLLKKTGLFAHLTNGGALDWQLFVLHEMEAAGMLPTQTTLHNMILGFMRKSFDFLRVFPDILAEMKQFDIEPDFTAWSFAAKVMLNCTPMGYRKETQPSQHHMEQVRRYLREGLQYLQAHPQDVYCVYGDCFFPAAMNVCFYLEDSELALQVNDFRDSLGSKYVVTQLQQDKLYYLNLLDTVVKTEPCDKVMEIYNKSYGHGWMEDDTFLRVLSSVNTFKAYEQLPYLFEDYMQRQKMPSSNVLETFFNMMANKHLDEEMKKTFHEQASYIFGIYKQYFEDERKPLKMRNKPTWMATIGMIKVFLNYGDLEKAWACVLMAEKYQADLDFFSWRADLMPLIMSIIEARDQAKVEKFVSLANSSWNFVVDVEAFRPGLAKFMTPADIEALKKQQLSTTRAKYDLLQ